MSNHKSMTLAAVRKAVTGSKPITGAQYDDMRATVAAGRTVMVLLAYAVRERGIVGSEAGMASLSRLAQDTVPQGRSEAAWRSTLSKYANAYGWLTSAGITDADDATIDLAVRAYDSTAVGRTAVAQYVVKSEGKADAAAFREVLTEAVATKSAARQTREARPNDGTVKATPVAEIDPAVWAASLVALVDAAPANLAGLDADTLARLSGVAAVLVDAVADAAADMAAAAGTRANRKAGRKA